MPHRVYRCRVCGATEERVERWDDIGPMRCPKCHTTAYHRVPQLPASVVVKGSAHVNGERRFVRERVVQNPDGSETKYGSLQAAREGELERARRVVPPSLPGAGLARTLLAKSNARKLASGMLPGRDSTLYRQAVEEPRR
jgi:putative FmdB family regulatory protein